MDDLISRQAAIEAITDERIAANMDSVYDSELHRCKRATHRILASLPSAERRGRWVDLKCDQCGQVDMSKPNCGAKMEV